MAAVKEYQANILPIINDLRASGLSDSHILQIFELAMHSPIGKDTKKEDKAEPIATFSARVYEDHIEANASGDGGGVLRGLAGLIVGYSRSLGQPVGASIAELIIEPGAIDTEGIVDKEES